MAEGKKTVFLSILWKDPGSIYGTSAPDLIASDCSAPVLSLWGRRKHLGEGAAWDPLQRKTSGMQQGTPAGPAHHRF